jgi:dihydroxyacetone kinase-like predicted kinase
MYELVVADENAIQGLRRQLEQLGNSVAIASAGQDAIGAQSLEYSVHVHTPNAGAAVEAGLALGTLSRIQISVITTSKTARNTTTAVRVVLAVVDGDGAAELFSEEGACVLRATSDSCDTSPGVTAKTLVQALVDTGASQVMVLPNGFVAAEELVAGCTAGIGLGIDVIPLPVASMVQGLAALAVHDPGRQAVDDGYTMARAAAGTRYGSVRVATENALTWAGGCKPGDGLGISGGEVLVVGPDVTSAAVRLIDLFLTAGGELVTVLIGDDIDPRIGQLLQTHVHRGHLGIEFATYRTAHRGDALIIGVE